MKQYTITYPENTPAAIISAWETIRKNINTTGELNGIAFPDEFNVLCDYETIDFEPIKFTQKELVAIYTVFGAMTGYDNEMVCNDMAIDVYGKIDKVFIACEFEPVIADIRLNIKLHQ